MLFRILTTAPLLIFTRRASGLLGITLCQDDIPTAVSEYCQYSTNSPDAYTPGYTVTTTPCPTTIGHVRSATGLGSLESQWLKTRTKSAFSAVETYLSGAGTGYAVDKLMGSPPRLGLAFSGGGFRAMVNGAGVLQAFNDHTRGGGVSGIVNSSLYISGLSGGSWLVGTWALNGFPSIESLTTFWNLTSDPDSALLSQFSPGLLTVKTHLQWPFITFHGSNDWGTCYPTQCEASQKLGSLLSNGLNGTISYADVWSRLMARQYLRNLPGGVTWSSVSKSDTFKGAEVPFPIIVSTGRTAADQDELYPYDETIYEMTPFEFGSWDPVTTGAFAPMSELGTSYSQGVPEDGTCVQGFDNAAFILGTSSLAVAGFLIKDLNLSVAESTSNIPNPFCGFGNGVQADCATYGNALYLEDGGLDDQNIPLVPLLQPSRELDAIIAVDNSDDSGNAYNIKCGYNWPLAVSLNSTLAYARSTKGQAQKIAFPGSMPTQEQVRINPTYVYTPTFFGCNASDSTLPGAIPPIIIYLPNAPYTSFSNASTASTLDYEYGSVLQELLENGNALASTGIPETLATGLPTWGACLACAIAERSRLRNDLPRAKSCEACFDAYCWETKAPIAEPIAGGPACDGEGTWYDPPALLTSTPAKGTKDYEDWTWAWLCDACNHNCHVWGCETLCAAACHWVGFAPKHGSGEL
ncbi:hypothetical protein JX266_003312 [Neoarthrinium moseri]|nr:hypothetical protein JX266_003312 [Neoarthrinium moseri]